MKKIVGRETAATLHEMVVALMNLQPQGKMADEVYVTINSDSIKLTLVEETLTDGSLVYNIELSEVSK